MALHQGFGGPGWGYPQLQAEAEVILLEGSFPNQACRIPTDYKWHGPTIKDYQIHRKQGPRSERQQKQEAPGVSSQGLPVLELPNTNYRIAMLEKNIQQENDEGQRNSLKSMELL